MIKSKQFFRIVFPQLHNVVILSKVNLYYYSLKNKKRKNQVIQQDSDQKLQSRKDWKEEEDNKLQAAVYKHGSNWKLIAKFVPGRNAYQCAQRQKRIKPKEKSKWTDIENGEVLRLKKIYQFKWKQIANEIPNRTGRQIRERYVNHLDSNIIRTPWTKQEDKKIWEMYQKMGTRLSNMSKNISGRPVKIKQILGKHDKKQILFLFKKIIWEDLESILYYQIRIECLMIPNKIRVLDEDDVKQSQGIRKIRKFKKIYQSFKVEDELEGIEKKISEEQIQKQLQNKNANKFHLLYFKLNNLNSVNNKFNVHNHNFNLCNILKYNNLNSHIQSIHFHFFKNRLDQIHIVNS